MQSGEVLNHLNEFLRRLPDVQVQARRETGIQFGLAGARDMGADAKIDISIAGKPMTLLIQVKNVVFPRDARERLWTLRRSTLDVSDPNREAVPIIAAEAISPGAKDLLREEKVGYYDTGGSFFLTGDRVYVLLDRPAAKPIVKTNRSLFSNRRAQVVHALLANPTEWIAVKDLARSASVSGPTASQVLRDLEKFDWVIARGSGPTKQRKLSDSRALLDAWAKHVISEASPSGRRFFVPSLSAESLAERVDTICTNLGVTYAVTQELAAQLYAPFLSKISQAQVRLPLDDNLEQLIQELSAREVREGANLLIIQERSGGQFLFRQRVHNIWLASPILVFLDLLRAPGRGRDTAENLRRERIGF